MATQSLMQIYDTATKAYRSFTTDDLASIGGGGGGGDASAANQLTAISRLDTLITDLGTRVSEITGVDILIATQDVRSQIEALGNGATLFDLFSRLGDIDSRLTADALTQADIASDTQLSTLALQAMEPDIEEIRGDADAARIASEALVSAIGEFPTFVVSTGAQTTPALNGSMISIALAPLSSVGKLRLRDLRIRNAQTANITGVVATFGLFRFATHSAGTALTPQTADSADALSGDVTVRRGAAIAGELANAVAPIWYLSTDEWAVGATEIESVATIDQNARGLIASGIGTRYPTIRPGEGLTVKLLTSLAAPAQFEVTATFTQE